MTAEPGIRNMIGSPLRSWEQFPVTHAFGEGTPLTLSENEKVSNKWSNFGSDSDKESIGGGIGLQKSKTKAKKKRYKGVLGKGKKSSGVKRKATVLISKKIVKEAKLRNMPLSEYIRQ